MTRPDSQAAPAGSPSADRRDAAKLGETLRRYERYHPGDKLADVIRQTSFSKEDRRLLGDRLIAMTSNASATDG